MFPHPIIFGYEFEWFLGMQRIGIVVSIIFFIFLYKNVKEKLPIKYAAALILCIIVLGYIGSRCIEVFEVYLSNGVIAQKYTIIENITTYGGLRWYGAMFFNVVFLSLITYKSKIKKILSNFIDYFVAALSLGLVIGKIGCGIEGHGCYGAVTNLALGQRYPYGTMPSFLPVHPTALYEAFFVLLFFLFAIWYLKYRTFKGELTLFFLITYSVMAAFIEILRVNIPDVFLNLGMGQILYTTIFIWALTFYIMAKSKIYKQASKPNQTLNSKTIAFN